MKVYHAAGAAVPPAALYRGRLSSDGDASVPSGSGFNLIAFMLVTQHITGVPLPDTASDAANVYVRRWAWLDLVLGNFDVCGVGFSNLIHVFGNFEIAFDYVSRIHRPRTIRHWLCKH